MKVPPPSLSEKFAQAITLWLCAAFISIPLWDAITLLLFCLFTPPGLANIHICLPVLTIVQTFVNWMEAKRDIGPIAAHYWPVLLIASAFTVLVLRRWWGRRS